MTKRGIISKIFGSFIVNLVLGSYIAYLLFVAYSNLTFGRSFGDLSFLSSLIIVFLLFPLIYAYNKLRSDTPFKFKSQTIIFTLSMLYFEPFVTNLVFLPLGFPSFVSSSNISEFAFFLAELFAFVPLIVIYSIMAGKINRRKELENKLASI